MRRPTALIAFIMLLLTSHAGLAQDERDEREAEERAYEQAFQDGMVTIVEGFNVGSFDAFRRALSKDEFIERIFGLRLIDGAVKRDFREDMQDASRWRDFVASFFENEAEDGLKATLLAVESRGDRGRAVVRYDMTFFRANYHEYDLRLDENGRMRIIDWKDFYWGHKFTDRMGLTMVQAKPNASAARKLLSFPSTTEQQVFQITELLKATRDRNFDRYDQIMKSLDAKLKTEPVVIKISLDSARAARKRRMQRQALELVAERFPEDPLFSIALLDFYIPEKRYDDAIASLERLQNYLGIDDALVNARLSAIYLAKDDVEQAHALAMKSITQDADVELGWWSLLRARTSAENYAEAIEALVKLEEDFGHSLGPDALSKDPTFRAFMLSDDYRKWFEGSD